MGLVITDAGVGGTRSLDSGEVFGYSAENIRDERTGVHARVSIQLDGHVLSYDTFNLGRDRDRFSLAKSAHGRLGGVVKKVYPLTEMRIDLDDFCGRVWPAWLSRYRAEQMGGDPEIGPPSFLLKPYICEGCGAILYAPPGRGKSYLTLLIAISIDAGCSTIWPVKQARVMFINLERSTPSLGRRIGMANLALGIEQQRPLLILNARGRSLSSIMEAVREDIREHEVKMIVLDSLSRAGLGKLTEDVPANAAMDALNALCPTWLATGHTPRQDETHVYGSTMFDAAIDIGIQLLSQRLSDGTLGLGLQVTKANDIAIPPLEKLALEFDQYGLSGVRHAGKHEFPELTAGRKTSMTEDVEEYLLSVGQATATLVAQETGHQRAKVSAILQGSQFVRFDRTPKGIPYGMKSASVP